LLASAYIMEHTCLTHPLHTHALACCKTLVLKVEIVKIDAGKGGGFFDAIRQVGVELSKAGLKTREEDKNCLTVPSFCGGAIQRQLEEEVGEVDLTTRLIWTTTTTTRSEIGCIRQRGG
jgi:hypothetical protein